jgi:hypothetical protein
MLPASPSSTLLLRLLSAVGAGGLFAGGFVVGRSSVEGAQPAAAPAASASGGYVRVKPGSYPPPPPQLNACYAAGRRTAPLPCVDVADPQLPMLIGQCQHPATNIAEGPATAQYAGSPAVICCYRADMPSCSGRPLRVDGRVRVALLASEPPSSSPGRGWALGWPGAETMLWL